MSELLGIDIKILDYGEFKFYQTVLIHKFLEVTGTEHCDGFITPTKVEAHIGIDDNVYEAKRDCYNSYYYVIGIILYL